MKPLLLLISILAYQAVTGQQSVSFKKMNLVEPESFSSNRQRVWETLANLPIEKSDWRYADLKNNFLGKWQKEIFGTSIFYVSSITDSYIETPSMYYAPTPEGNPPRIEHELGHAAFLGVSNMPGWLLYLGDITAKVTGSENSLPHERIVMAMVVRRDIIDHFGISLDAAISDNQLRDYITHKTGHMDYGLKWLIETTKEDRLRLLLNFENGYKVNELLGS